MAGGDSISVFAEGTFEEQVLELAEFIARSRPEAEQPAFKQSIADTLKSNQSQEGSEPDINGKRIIISQLLDAVGSVGEEPEREVEGFFNLLTAHLVAIYDQNSPEFSTSIDKIIGVVSGSATEATSIKYRILANLFNATPRTSPVRLAICKALVKVGTENDGLETLNLSPASVDRWLAEWNASSEDKSNLLQLIANAFELSGQTEKALSFSLSYTRSLPTSAAQDASLHLIATAVGLPNYFDFDSVSRVDNIQSIRTHDLYSLLSILTSQGLDELRAWIASHKDILEKYSLEESNLERKIRLMTLADLAFSRRGQNISYEEIAAALQVNEGEAERWAIDVIREGLLAGKLSQTTKTLHVLRATPRGFTMDHWVVLESRLLAWKEGLEGINSVLQSAKPNVTVTSVAVPEQAA